MSTFAWSVTHWPTVAAFATFLAGRDPAMGRWAQGLTIHHTAIPTVAQWRGRTTMDGLGRFYRDTKGWPGGPHLFIGPDGIWQGTPLGQPGVHAIGANATRWGVEVVGDYTHVAWSEPIRSLAFGALAALLRWRDLGVSPATVDGHRNYNKPACPGAAIDLDRVRAELGRMLATPGAITADSAILAPPRATAAQCSRFILCRPHGAYTDHDIADVIVPGYVATAVAVGLDPLVAISQMVHETGNLASGWAARPHRNPAGIGVTGVPGVGVSFPTWVDDAIPAHIGRLLAYAVAPGASTPAQAALITRALRYRPLPASDRGAAPTLRGLNGRWAVPGTTYADAIAVIANQIRGQ